VYAAFSVALFASETSSKKTPADVVNMTVNGGVRLGGDEASVWSLVARR
jgi:hypothetical protein